MNFKDPTLSGILRSLAADEYLAWMQYFFGNIISQGKQLNFLNKILETNGKDELDDHYNKLVTWMQSKDIPVETDYNVMQEICNTKYDIGFKDPSDTRAILEHQIKAEEEAIDAYTQAMIEPEIVKYPDLVVMLGEICMDEREHLKDLNDVMSAVKGGINGNSDYDQIMNEYNKIKGTNAPLDETALRSLIKVNFSTNPLNISGDWIHEFLNNKINELGELIQESQANIDELTEMNNLDWELGATISKLTPKVLKDIKDYCTKNKYIEVTLDETEDQFIYYNQVSLITKVSNQIFVFKLKGSLLNSDLVKLVESFDKSNKKVSNFAERLRIVNGGI